MGMYSNYEVQYDGTPDETIDSIMSDPSVVAEDYTDIKEYGLNILTTMTINYNLIHEHIAFAELRHITESGTPMVYTEGVISSIFNAIKRFLQKIWERIKGLFKRFMMIINSYSKTDKEFANKYRKEIFAYHDLSDFTFKGYKWTIEEDKITKTIKYCSDSAKYVRRNPNSDSKEYDTALIYGNTVEAQRKFLEKFDDIAEEFRGMCIEGLGGHKSKYTSEEFRKELKACFRHGEESKEELDDKDIDVHDMFAWLIGSKDAKKIVDRIFKENKRAIDDEIKDLDSKQKAMSNDMPIENPDKKVEDKYNTKRITHSGKSYTILIPSSKTDSLKDYESFIKSWVPLMNLDQSLIDDYNELKKDVNNDSELLALIQRQIGKSGYYSHDDSKEVPGEITNKEDRKRHALQLQGDMKLAQMSKQCLIEIDTAVLDAIKERSRQYKACLIKIVHHKGKSEAAYTESTTENDYFFKSNPVDAYLGSITFK